MTTRLADYFVVVGYDIEKDKNEESVGVVIQTFPQNNWDDYPFEFHIETFCQPCGWKQSHSMQAPTFFIAYLTDTLGNRYYCATLTFYEPFTPKKCHDSLMEESTHSEIVCGSSIQLIVNGCGDDNQGNSFDPNLVRPPEIFVPKCLILLARHSHFKVLKNTLSIIYSVYADSQRQFSLEQIIANALSAVDVPPVGGARMTFSIGCGDHQVILPALYPTIPVTGTSVTLLFKLLGIQNVLILFSAILTDNKVLLYSRSFSRLTEACHALSSLTYPLICGHVFIPILPKELLDVLSAPTPFIAGVHVACKPFVLDNLNSEVFIADLDGGSVQSPDNTSHGLLIEPFYSEVFDCLTKILNSDLLTADYLFVCETMTPPDPAWQDKRIRAVFIRLFCQLFSGYRCCLTVTRINPHPVLHFHKEKFLLLRGLSEEDGFISRLLTSMSFDPFVLKRGPPFRVCDIFDEVYDSLTKQLDNEREFPEGQLHHIDRLARRLWENENNSQLATQQLPPLATQAHSRLHQTNFPKLDSDLVDTIIKQNLNQKKNKGELRHEEPIPQYVPQGPILDKSIFNSKSLSDKKKVIRQFVEDIFSNHITEALKRRNTIRQDLKSRLIRRIFIDDLNRQLLPGKFINKDGSVSPSHSTSQYNENEQRSVLSYEQFDLIVDLLEETLRQECHTGNSGAVPIILELSTKFCMKLRNQRYYANMSPQIQNHSIWEMQSFWEQVFNDQVNHQMKQLYIHYSESQKQLIEQAKHATNHSVKQVMDQRCPNYSSQQSTLEIMAEELRISHMREHALQAQLRQQEESAIYAQILHMMNLMVNLRLPVDICATRAVSVSPAGEHIDSGASHGESENGFNHQTEQQSATKLISSLENWIRKFVDKVGAENNVEEKRLVDIKNKIQSMIEGHMMNLESIYPDVRNLPKSRKPEVKNPVLIDNETTLKILDCDSLRCQLLLDGRFERVDWFKLYEKDPCFLTTASPGGGSNSPSNSAIVPSNSINPNRLWEDEVETLKPLLPAVGALFITNYRVIFRGAPKDPYQSNKLVCRSFPISALHRVKKLDSKEEAGLELRSNTMQLMRIAFDPDETRPNLREEISRMLTDMRYPENLQKGLTFLKRISDGLELVENKCERLSDEASSASGSFSGSVRQTKSTVRRAKDTLNRFNPISKDRNRSSSKSSRRSHSVHESDSDRSSLHDFPGEDAPGYHVSANDGRRQARLKELCAYREFERLKLGSMPITMSCKKPSISSNVKSSFVNISHDVCKTYPALLILPSNFDDKNISNVTKVARCHRLNRFPVVVWQHPKTKAYLLRGSAFQNKGLFGFFKQTPGAGNSSSNAPLGVQLNDSDAPVAEHERYLLLMAEISPRVDEADAHDLLIPLDFGYKSSTLGSRKGGSFLNKNIYGFKSSTKPNRTLPRRNSREEFSSLSGGISPDTVSISHSINYSSLSDTRPVPLYILAEKSQAKSLTKSENFPLIDFIPTDFLTKKQIRESFNDLISVCLPSAHSFSANGGGPSGSTSTADNSVPAEANSTSTTLGGRRKGNFLADLQNCDWLNQIRHFLQLGGMVVDLLDLQQASVAVCLEDGMYATTEIVSLAQVMLDPHYRTIKGFWSLVEKEWLMFGHPFNRCNVQMQSQKHRKYTPIFLQFLDAVHQLVMQFPLAFEFHEFFLRFIAYHHMSNRFVDFKYDNESERINWLTADNYKDFSIWEYIHRQHEEWPIFSNLRYSPNLACEVLRPATTAASLRIWDYYLTEDLHTGSVYDLDLFCPSYRNQTSIQYEPLLRHGFNNSHVEFIYGILNMREGDRPIKWLKLWKEVQDKANQNHPSRSKDRDYEVWYSTARIAAMREHRRVTLQLLNIDKSSSNILNTPAQSRTLANSDVFQELAADMTSSHYSIAFENAHSFVKASKATANRCQVCSHHLLALGSTRGVVRCQFCDFICHEKCSFNIPKNCPGQASQGYRNDGHPMNLSGVTRSGSFNNVGHGNYTPRNNRQPSLHTTERMRQPEGVTKNKVDHDGMLDKQSHHTLVPQWKTRYFVLDIARNQLRYYDASFKEYSRGHIDLQEVRDVRVVKNVGGQKKFTEACIIELVTPTRTYRLAAKTENEAKTWEEKLKACL